MKVNNRFSNGSEYGAGPGQEQEREKQPTHRAESPHCCYGRRCHWCVQAIVVQQAEQSGNPAAVIVPIGGPWRGKISSSTLCPGLDSIYGSAASMAGAALTGSRKDADLTPGLRIADYSSRCASASFGSDAPPVALAR